MKKALVMAVAFGAAVLVCSSAFAAGPLRAVGVEGGYVSPNFDGIQDAGGTWVAGVFLDFGMPMTNLYVNPFVNYWNWSDGTGSAETSFHDWTIGANLKFAIPTAGKIQPFIAAGASAHLLNVSQDALNLDQGDTKIGFQAGAGVKVGVSQSANIIGSGWYNVVDTADNWSLRAGLSWTI
jgi:opacity protein-like surface antigen